MNNFSDQLTRLKRQLGVSKDQEVAEALGLSKTAFSERKRRNAFPFRELISLSATLKEKNIDVTYVMTGEAQQDRLVVAAASPLLVYDEAHLANFASAQDPVHEQLLKTFLSEQEALLLDAFRRGDQAHREALIAVARSVPEKQ